jgi:hypothetical protein
VSHAANAPRDVTSQYVAQHLENPPEGPYQPIPEDVQPRLARAAFAILGAQRGLGNYEQVTKGAGHTQEQQLTEEAVRAGDIGDRARQITRMEVMHGKPELYSSNREGVLSAATGKLDTSGALTQADIGAQNALAQARLEHAQSIKTGGPAATARMQVFRHAVDDLDMSEEEALQFTRSMFGSKADMSTAEIGRRRYDAVLKATGSSKQAQAAEAALLESLKPPQSKVQSTGEGSKQMREHVDLEGAGPAISTKDAKAVETLRGIKTDRAKLRATVQMLQQQGYKDDQIKTLLQKAGVPE